MSTPRFQELTVKRVNPEAAGSVAITFDIPPSAREAYRFEPGQFLTLRATVNGEDVRRSYSISSPRSRLAQAGELEIGIRPVLGGLFSNWASNSIKVGDKINVMTRRALHRAQAARHSPSRFCSWFGHHADFVDCGKHP